MDFFAAHEREGSRISGDVSKKHGTIADYIKANL